MILAELLSRWIPDDLGTLLDMLLDSVVCLGTAVACGYIVGREREHSEKPAGVRTHILVCAGSAAFVHLGVIGSSIAGLSTISDFNRLVQSIATGIGFLGAGAIFRSRVSVHGVTTAASIWAMGAVGAAAGAGAVLYALLLAGAMYLVLRWSGDLPILDEHEHAHEHEHKQKQKDEPSS